MTDEVLNVPEMQVLLACGRCGAPDAPAGRVQQLLDAGVDWNRLLGMATRHGMLPLLLRCLARCGARIPDGILERLQYREARNTQRMLQITGEMLRVAGILRAGGIRAVPYKGPALSLRLYGSPALRQPGDIDILVRRRDVARARSLLAETGYLRQHQLSAAREAFMLRSRYGEGLSHPSGFGVELHWAFTNRDVAFPLVLEDLEGRLDTISIGGEVLPVFGIEDLLLILSLHGSKHRWDRLEWLCGMTAAIDRAGAIDWDELLARATATGARRTLLLALLLSHDLLGAGVRPDIVQRARADRAIARVAGEIPTILFEPPIEAETFSLPVDLFRLRLRDRLRDRVRFVLYRITTPSDAQAWSVVTLGNRMIPVHALRRPFHLLSRALRALLTSRF